MSEERELLNEVADQLDRGADESRRGGWSTHQVDPQRMLAARLSPPREGAHDCEFDIALTMGYMGCECGRTRHRDDVLAAPPREGAGTTQREDVERLPRFIVRFADEECERFFGVVPDPFGPWLRRSDVLALFPPSSESRP